MITIVIPEWILWVVAGMWVISTTLRVIVWKVNRHLQKTIDAAKASTGRTYSN